MSGELPASEKSEGVSALVVVVILSVVALVVVLLTLNEIKKEDDIAAVPAPTSAPTQPPAPTSLFLLLDRAKDRLPSSSLPQ